MNFTVAAQQASLTGQQGRANADAAGGKGGRWGAARTHVALKPSPGPACLGPRRRAHCGCGPRILLLAVVAEAVCRGVQCLRARQADGHTETRTQTG